MLLTLAALTNIVALGIGRQVLELANLMRQLDFLLIIVLHFFLRRSQIVRHELLHLSPDIKEILEVTITYFVESLKLLAVLRVAELADELLSRRFEVVTDEDQFFGRWIVLIFSGLYSATLSLDGGIAIFEKGMSPKEST